MHLTNYSINKKNKGHGPEIEQDADMAEDGVGPGDMEEEFKSSEKRKAGYRIGNFWQWRGRAYASKGFGGGECSLSMA